MRALLLAGLMLAGAAAPVVAAPVGGPPPPEVASVKLPEGQTALIGINWPKAVFFLDLESIVKTGDQVEVSVLLVIKPPPEVRGVQAPMTIQRERIDCAAGTHKILSRQGFTADGELVIWLDDYESEPTANSLAATDAARVVCKGERKANVVTGYGEALAMSERIFNGPPPPAPADEPS